MPQAGSPFTSVAPGLGGQAQALDPKLMQLAMQAIPGAQSSPTPPPPRDVMPPGAPPSSGGPPSYGYSPQQGQEDPSMGQDRIQRVVMLLMQNPSVFLPFYAGLGAAMLLDHMG